jgi:hypothetical protein
MQFEELFDQIRFDQASTLLFQRFLRRDPYIDYLCTMQGAQAIFDQGEDSDGKSSMKAVFGDIGGSFKNSKKVKSSQGTQSQKLLKLNNLLD